MEDIGSPLVRMFQLVFPALWAACAVAGILKLRPRAAGVLTGVGFGLICVIRCLDLLMREPWGYSRAVIVLFFVTLNLVAMTFVLIGLLCVRREESGAAAANTAAVPFGGTPIVAHPPRHRPGWGLVVAWIVLSAVSLVLGLVTFALFLEAGSSMSDSEMESILGVVAIDLLLAVPTAIVFFVWLHRAWDAVPPQYRGTTPGRAVGFLFIPFFNLYWVFRAIPGLSASIGRARAALVGGPPGGAGFGIGIAACVVCMIPYLGILAWPLFLTWVVLANAGRSRMLGEQQAALAGGWGGQATPLPGGS